MSTTIMVVSRDKLALHYCSVAIKSASHRPVCVSSLEIAATVAKAEMAQLILLGYSFSFMERHMFIEELRAVECAVPVLSRDLLLTSPAELLTDCEIYAGPAEPDNAGQKSHLDESGLTQLPNPASLRSDKAS